MRQLFNIKPLIVSGFYFLYKFERRHSAESLRCLPFLVLFFAKIWDKIPRAQVIKWQEYRNTPQYNN